MITWIHLRLVQTYAPNSWENGGEQDRIYPFARHTFKYACTNHNGSIKLYCLRDEGIAWPAWGLVSMWHHPSCRQLLMLSWRKTSAYSGQHLPILMMCMWMKALCLRHVWRSISAASASSVRSRRGYWMVHQCLGYKSRERITLCFGEEGTKFQTCLVSSRNGTYFHYAANWLGTFPCVVDFV